MRSLRPDPVAYVMSCGFFFHIFRTGLTELGLGPWAKQTQRGHLDTLWLVQANARSEGIASPCRCNRRTESGPWQASPVSFSGLDRRHSFSCGRKWESVGDWCCSFRAKSRCAPKKRLTGAERHIYRAMRKTGRRRRCFGSGSPRDGKAANE